MSVRENMERIRIQNIYHSNYVVTTDFDLDWDLSDDILEYAFRNERIADLLYRCANGPALHRRRWLDELVTATRSWKENL